MPIPQLTDLTTLQAILEKARIHLRSEKSQHFLISPEVVEATVTLVKTSAPRLTELGAGLGTLTQGLATAGCHIRAIEKDAALAALLPKFIPPAMRQNVEVVNKDLREVPWDWGHEQDYQVVGNIPYAFSGLIIRRLTQLEPSPTQAILLVQHEVGKRLTAKAGDMSLLSLAVQLWGTAQEVLFVPKSCFLPPPAVDSSLIYIARHQPEKYPLPQREQILKVASVFFQGKRKQMGGMLRKHFNIDSPDSLLADLGLTPTQRPQELTHEQWGKLAAKLSPS